MDRLFTYWVVRNSKRMERNDSGASDVFQMDDVGEGANPATDLEAGGIQRITVDLFNINGINGLPTSTVQGRPLRTSARAQSEHR